MLSLVRFWLICVLKPRSKTTQRNDLGFTMIELLVSAVVASMIITPILFFVVDVLQTDTREEIRARSEQELQTAADFIRRDLSQAIYIYDGEGVGKIRSQLPHPEDDVVLVFWRQEFIPNAVPPCDDRGDRCNDAQVYSLVAYYLQTGASDTWSGQARISRLQIQDCPREGRDCVDGTEPDKGFQLPSFQDEGTLQEIMNGWRASGTITEPREVLIDYIYPDVVAGLAADHCRTALNLTESTDPDEDDLLSGEKGSGFFVCVDSARTTALVNLRMNAAIRIDPNAETFNRNQEPLFPATSFLVKGLGAFN
ncbi:hormogonium polysaccharide secretion pseudopilin HpsC [Limnospira fusiformis]|uniref:hormogonium polysaccharide secretion pseudopilin HpsC n=1 Tax=Limnospira fusiformis TaxID=54297 RepID=UPI002AA268A7|nr:hormogonium polysaccharide secretion pseudopilin HpsC [Limnospira fusiformis LS22]